MSLLVDDAMTFTPEMLRVNPALDSDAARRMWEFAQQAAEAGRPVVVSAVEPTYSVAEVARMFGVSVSSVKRSIADGTLEAVKKGSYWRVSEYQIARFRDYRFTQLADLIADEFDF